MSDSTVRGLVETFVGAGDDAAARQRALWALVNAEYENFRRLAAKILHADYPALARDHPATSIADGAVLKMVQYFETHAAQTGFDFLKDSARVIRETLCDLARKQRTRKKHGLLPGADTSAAEVADSTEGGSNLLEWTEYWEKVASLPTELREVIDLEFEGHTQSDIATTLGITQPAVSKRLLRARLLLGPMPE